MICNRIQFDKANNEIILVTSINLYHYLFYYYTYSARHLFFIFFSFIKVGSFWSETSYTWQHLSRVCMLCNLAEFKKGQENVPVLKRYVSLWHQNIIHLTLNYLE